jgi:hypothetical protein
MKRRDLNSKSRSSLWLESPIVPTKVDTTEASGARVRSSIDPGFLAHHWSVTAVNELKKNWLALDMVRRAKATFVDHLCRESLSQDAAILGHLASDPMFAFAEFYYAIHAMGLTGADDIIVLLDMHNERIAALANIWLPPHWLAGAIFPDVELIRLEEIWRDMPGGLQQSMLARFLAPHMREEIVYMLVIACEEAGFVTRTATVRNSVVVSSTGVMEEIMTTCLRDMRLAICEL